LAQIKEKRELFFFYYIIYIIERVSHNTITITITIQRKERVREERKG